MNNEEMKFEIGVLVKVNADLEKEITRLNSIIAGKEDVIKALQKEYDILKEKTT